MTWAQASMGQGWSESEVADLRRCNYSDEQIREIVGRDAVKPCGIWPENEAAVDVFTACNWQRHFGAMGGAIWIGIAAPEIESVMRMQRHAPRDRPALFAAVRIMAAAARPRLNEIESQRAEEARS